jgi:hypothetical protein
MRGKTIFGLTMVIALFASLLPVAFAPTTTRMYLDPSTLTVDQGAIFTINVMVEDVTDMYAWEFKINIDNTVLTLLKPPKEGPMLKSGGMTYFAWTYNPQSGVLLVGCTLLGAVPGVNGDGKIAEVRFIADEPGATTTIDLFDEKKYDSYLMLIPELPPGDATVTIQWPPALWETELWLSAAKGGKIWTEWQTGYMEWDPWYGAIYTWELNLVYARIRNTGTAGVYVRVWLTYTSEQTGVSENWDPWEDIPLCTRSAYVDPGDDVVVSMDIGVVDPWFLVWTPPTLLFESGKFDISGQIQVSMDSLRWYNWGDFDPALPGDGFSRVVPGGSTGKFHVHP